jgi:hypothetical protein
LLFFCKGHNVAPGTVAREVRKVILKSDALHNSFKTWVPKLALWFLSIDRY